MAALLCGGQYALTATARNITYILASLGDTRYDSTNAAYDPTKKFLKRLSIKNAKDAVNKLYIGDSNVTNVPANAHIELAPDESFDFYSGEGWLVSTDEVYLVGTTNGANIAFINGMA